MGLRLPESLIGLFTYVDCGAVGDFSNSLLSAFDTSRFVGFDPALIEPTNEDNTSIYFPVAVSKESGQANFNVTKNPNCSSFYTPNQSFLDRFMVVDDFFRITETVPLKIVALDEYLPKYDVNDIDFIELDTQGSELDILQGAEKFLSSKVLGIRVEVEFSPMYRGQPLFSDVDSFLRQYGFMLFDLERYHLRRKTSFTHPYGREQIVWGQALYLKDWSNVSNTFTKQKLGRLAVIASYYGFHSYAYEIVNYLLSDSVKILSPQEKQDLKVINESGLQNKKSRFYALFKYLYNKSIRPYNWLKQKATSSFLDDYFWKD